MLPVLVISGVAAWLVTGTLTTETFVGLSGVGHSLVAFGGSVVAFVSGALYVRASSGGAGRFELTELRSRDRSRWRMRGLLSAVCAGAIAMVCGWLGLRGLVPHLHGVLETETVTIRGFRHGVPSGPWCEHWVQVEATLPPGVDLCIESTDFAGGPRAEIAALKAGDRVLIRRRHNWLGDSIGVDPL